MKRYVISARARLDLISTWTRLVERANVDVADKELRVIRRELQRIIAMPGIGHVRNELKNDALRVWRASVYLIIYNPTLRPLSVVRVVHGSRDLSSIVDDSKLDG